MTKESELENPSRGNSPKVFNSEEFLRRAQGSHEHVDEISQLFLKTFPARLQLLQDAFGVKDIARLMDEVHRLKGALRFVHAERAIESAIQLENSKNVGDEILIGTRFRDFEHELRVLVRHLRRLLEINR